jgi:acetyl esterase/lipase
MVHGGAWSVGDKANENTITPKKDYFADLGYIFVSINYRLSPQYFFPDYPTDVANAIKWVKNNITNYGGNTDKIFVMGHSAGAHLVALSVFDKNYGLQDLGLKGLILLDGAGYDIPLTLKSTDKEIRIEAFQQAFGKDLEIQKQASPIYHITTLQTDSENTDKQLPKTLILYVERRRDSKEQSENLHQKLIQSGHRADIFPISNTTHEQLNTNLGKPDFLATQKVESFLGEF